MREAVFVIGFNLAVGCAFARAAGVIVGAARSYALRGRFRIVRIGFVEVITLLEPVVLAVTAYLLLVNRASAGSVTLGQAIASLAGGLIALAGFALVGWTLVSWRALFVGHAVLEDQRLVTRGAYAIVRHPVYLAALLIWCGLGVCFLSPEAAGITFVYVAPSYMLYIRSEEVMMLDEFGDEYRRYRQLVPMLLPRPRQTHR
jgi:protein-S-isoprenylcysteine O-methyltransferase Ste14